MTETKTAKPLRTIMRLPILVGLALVLLLVLVTLWASTRRPVITENYAARLEERCADAQPPGRNGWEDLVAATRVAARLHGAFPEADRPTDGRGRPVDLDVLALPPELRDAAAVATVDRMVAWLETEGAFAHLDRAAGAERFVRPMAFHEVSLHGFLLPELAEVRRLGQALRHRARRRAAAGELPAALDDIRRIVTMARAIGAQMTLIDHLVAQSHLKIVGALVRELAMAGATGPEARAALAEAFAGAHPLPPLALALEGERASFLDAVQRLYAPGLWGIFCPGTANELEDGHAILGSLPGTAAVPQLSLLLDRPDRPDVANVAGLAFASRGAVEAEANAFFDDLIARSQLSAAARRAAPTPNSSVRFEQLGWRYWPLQVLLPAVDHAVYTRDLIEADVAATLITLAILDHRDEHGALPSDLDSLVPDRLAAVPLDPDDGKPLRYAVDGREWMLYGVGRDRRDDGGRHRRDDPETGSRRAKDGFDVVYAITPAMRERTAE